MRSYILFFRVFHTYIEKTLCIPTREMGPRELLKFSSPSFGRSGDWVMSWDSSRPPASPLALGLV